MRSLGITWHASKFQFARGIQRGYRIIRWHGDIGGLYLSGFRNNFNTSLAASGPIGYLELYVAKLKEDDA